jgi:hypothetical protein
MKRYDEFINEDAKRDPYINPAVRKELPNLRILEEHLSEVLSDLHVSKVKTSTESYLSKGDDILMTAYFSFMLDYFNVEDDLVKIKNALKPYFYIEMGGSFDLRKGYYEFSINYDEYKKSDLAKSIMGMDKYNL